jgi:hypothetical protein
VFRRIAGETHRTSIAETPDRLALPRTDFEGAMNMNEMSNTTSGMVIRSTIYVLRNLPQVFRGDAPPVSYDMQFKDSRDGCARYDDVWGG